MTKTVFPFYFLFEINGKQLQAKISRMSYFRSISLIISLKYIGYND